MTSIEHAQGSEPPVQIARCRRVSHCAGVPNPLSEPYKQTFGRYRPSFRAAWRPEELDHKRTLTQREPCSESEPVTRIERGPEANHAEDTD